MGSITVKEAVARSGVDLKDIDEVIMGNVIQAGLGQNPARQAALYAGLPDAVAAFTVNKVCASGLKAVGLASDAIRAGSADVIVAGGMENMSRAPYLLKEARWGVGYNHAQFIDAMLHDGLWDIYNNFHMIMTGEIIAKKWGATREEQDRFALESHQKAARAIKEGKFCREIVPVDVSVDGKQVRFDTDEGVRFDTSLEKLSKLPVVLKEGSTVTAGNASQLSDGASALVVTSAKYAEKEGLKPMAKVVDYVTSGVRPDLVMEAPVPAVNKLLKKTNLTVADIDLFEHNEAYAAASLAVMKGLSIPKEKFNPNGGAVALGHPIGCSGARILTTLLYAMEDRGAEKGLVTLCLGGGNAVAMIVERP